MSHLSPRAELLARIDVATICNTLEISIGGASRQDMHLFGYLASMVNSQYGSAPSSWGYNFAASAEGFPFAEALDYALDVMVNSGEVTELADGYILSGPLRQRLLAIGTGSSFSERVQLMEDVTNVAVLRALPTIGRAVRAEPQLARSAQIRAVRLIDEQELSRTLVDLLLTVRDKLGADFPPSLPAMLWLDIWETADAS